MNLYELTQDFKYIQGLEFSEENEEQEIEQVKAIIKQEIENKGTGIIAVIKNTESDIETLTSEIKRLQALKKVKENKNERLKKYTKECLMETNINKVSTPLGNISIRKTPPSVEVIEENNIPEEFIKEEISYKIDKKEILKQLKDGVVISGVTLKTGTTLSIK